MQQTQTGSKSYLFTIVLVAVLGGLLFGYDTAVISGAEKGLQAFFMEAKDFSYTDGWHGFTSYHRLGPFGLSGHESWPQEVVDYCRPSLFRFGPWLDGSGVPLF